LQEFRSCRGNGVLEYWSVANAAPTRILGPPSLQYSITAALHHSCAPELLQLLQLLNSFFFYLLLRDGKRSWNQARMLGCRKAQARNKAARKSSNGSREP
jgi:hypothetical protein